MPTLKQTIWVILAVVVVHIFALAIDLYDVFEWFDILMHFAGGFAMGMLGMVFVHAMIEHIQFAPTRGEWLRELVRFMIVLGFVALIGIFWEWYEFLVDFFLYQFQSIVGWAQPSLRDTMADFFFDLAGGATAYYVFGGLKR